MQLKVLPFAPGFASDIAAGKLGKPRKGATTQYRRRLEGEKRERETVPAAGPRRPRRGALLRREEVGETLRNSSCERALRFLHLTFFQEVKNSASLSPLYLSEPPKAPSSLFNSEQVRAHAQGRGAGRDTLRSAKEKRERERAVVADEKSASSLSLRVLSPSIIFSIFPFPTLSRTFSV